MLGIHGFLEGFQGVVFCFSMLCWKMLEDEMMFDMNEDEL